MTSPTRSCAHPVSCKRSSKVTTTTSARGCGSRWSRPTSGTRSTGGGRTREPQTTVLRVLPPPVERVPEVGRLQRLPHPRAEVVVVTLLDRLQLTGCAQLLVGEVMVGFEQAVPCPAVAQPVGDDH